MESDSRRSGVAECGELDAGVRAFAQGFAQKRRAAGLLLDPEQRLWDLDRRGLRG